MYLLSLKRVYTKTDDLSPSNYNFVSKGFTPTLAGNHPSANSSTNECGLSFSFIEEVSVSS